MFGRNIREKSPHDGAQTSRDPLHEPRALRQSHHAQPQGHDSDQTQRDGDGRLCAIERAFGHFFEPVIPTADCDRQQNEREPDVIQHARL